MNSENVGLEILNTNEWKDNGGKGDEGCLMSLVKIGVFTVALAVIAVVAFSHGIPAIMDLWW